MAKKKDLSWDDIGEAIGKKIEHVQKQEKGPWSKNWYWNYRHESGGGFGRFLFIVGVLIALSTMGLLTTVPFWTQVLIVIGFTAMKF